MTQEKMTIHKALTELKTLDKRIDSELAGSVFLTTKKNNQDKVKGKTVEEFKKDARAQYQRVNDLIARRNAIKSAVIVSNSSTKVTINGDEYTVVEAIERKNHSMDYYVKLKDVLSAGYSACVNAVEKNNSGLQQKGENFVSMQQGADGKLVKDDYYTEQVNYYIKSNTMEIVDPLGAEEQIRQLVDKIDGFLNEVDAALSVSNALTTIEISY